MNPDIKRHRGGQPGNQNARTHGYYSSALSGVDKANLTQASQIIGLDDEIALRKARLKAVVQSNPDNIRLISEAASTLARLMRTSERLGFSKAERLEQVRWNLIYSMGSYLGWDINKIVASFLTNPQEACQADAVK